MKRIFLLIVLIIFGFSTQDLAAQTSKSKKKKFSFANIFKPKNKRKKNNANKGRTVVRSHDNGNKTTRHSSSKLDRKNRNKRGITSSKTKSASSNSSSRTRVREYDTSKYKPRSTKRADDDFKYDNYSSKTVLQKAYKYMGVPYVWGGSTPQGFDCSGFTQYVMRESGYQIPRTSSQQSKHGKKVNSRKLRSGDLVFFGDRKGDISHVGMVTSKKGKYFSMIHASSSKGVTVVDVNDSSYFQKRYQVARRVSK